VLDTIMALWNQRRKENRQKVGKIGLAFLFVCISVSLLLVVLSARSAEKSAVVEKRDMHQAVVVLPDATTKNVPTPSPTVRIAERIVPLCVRRPTVAATPRVSATRRAVYPSIISGTWSAPRPEHAPVKTKKKHIAMPRAVKRHHKPAPRKVSTVTPTATVLPTPVPTTTPMPTVSPVATATVSVTPTATIQDTPVTFIPPFMSGFAQGLVPVSYIIHNSENSAANGPERCENSETTPEHGVPLQHNKRWLLGSSLSVVVLLSFGVYVAERKKRFRIFKNSAKTP